MTIINTFTSDYKTQFSEYISLLFYLAKRSTTTPEQRIERAEVITESYFKHTGYRPDSKQLDRLASLILRDELADKDRMKVRNKEYPILSDDQFERRELGEVSFKLADEVGSDGRDYRPQTRLNRRILKNL